MTAEEQIKEVMEFVESYFVAEYDYEMARIGKDSVDVAKAALEAKLRQLIKDEA